MEHDAKYIEDNLPVGVMLDAYLERKQEGYNEIQIDKTIFLFKIKDKHIDYHTINAAPRQEYIDNINLFMTGLRNIGYESASTDLTNSKLKSFIKRYFSHNTVIQDDKAITFLSVEI